MNVGIIGAGYIGTKRAMVIKKLQRDSVAAIFDVDIEKSKALAEQIGSVSVANATEIFENKKIDTVIIATINNVSAELCLAGIKHKKNVFCEKPLGKNYDEAKRLYLAAKKSRVVLKVGFNHRFHAAVMQAYELVKKGVIGELLYMRAVYGHGGRKGYDLEWRMNKKLSGGGELLDQGVHLLDLSRWFLGEFNEGVAYCENMFWHRSKLEDNAFCMLRTKDGKVFQMQVSLTQWKNRFAIDLFGNKGYLYIHGKGGSYGKETLIIGKRKKLGVKPEEEEIQYKNDASWEEEWKDFSRSVAKKTQPLGNGYDGMMANKLIAGLYSSAENKKIISF